MKKRSIVVIMVLFSVMLLAGWGKKQVELLNDQKLIDLSKAIENCMGAESIKPAENPDGVVEPGSESLPDSEDTPKEKEIVISVRNKKVTYDNVEWKELDTLESKIRQDFKSNVGFKLVDDFAEAHVYRYIMKILAELESEIGIIYTMEQGGS